MQQSKPAFFLLLVILVTLGCYWGGVEGPFLFDDGPNLKALGQMGGVVDWPSFKIYVMGGWSGPSGRPLSLLSFLLNDQAWPSNPAGFKITNIELHLLCSLLLAWVGYLLLKLAGHAESVAQWAAVLSAAFWMLHPFMVSTTLYVVQRMTILSTAFMLAGMVGYLKGRLWLQQGKGPAWRAYLLMSLALVCGTSLAVLSKENGALLPLLILVIEAFLWRMGGGHVNHAWSVTFLLLPSLAVLGYLVSLVDFSTHPWPNRPFNQIERLLTESRILWDYLRNLWFPHVEGAGLFQDGLVISRGLLQPPSTLWALLGWAAVMGMTPVLYHKWPVVWFALVFFLCGHLVESTVVGLELYFEHRNYAPSLFMFLPLALGIVKLGGGERRMIAGVAGCGVLLLLAWMTWQRAQLWGDDDRLETYWAMYAPESARGRHYLIYSATNHGDYDTALRLADIAQNNLPDSALIVMTRLLLRVDTRQAQPEEFGLAAEALAKQPFDAQMVENLRVLVDDVTRGDALAGYRLPMMDMLKYLERDGPYRAFPVFMRLVAYCKARVFISLHRPDDALKEYMLAADRYSQSGAAMQMLAELASSGYAKHAIAFLNYVEPRIVSGRYDSSPWGMDYYRKELSRFRGGLGVSSVASQTRRERDKP